MIDEDLSQLSRPALESLLSDIALEIERARYYYFEARQLGKTVDDSVLDALEKRYDEVHSELLHRT